jgi:hypothetical protein
MVGTHRYKKDSVTTDDLVVLVGVGGSEEVGELYTAV